MLFVVASKRLESIDTAYKSIILFLLYYDTIYFKIYDSEWQYKLLKFNSTSKFSYYNTMSISNGSVNLSAK
jgi:hypothetical protein